MERGREAGVASDGGEAEGSRRRTPRHTYQHGQLGVSYRQQGRWKEAEELELRVMEVMRRVLGEEHPDTLTSMSNLATTYHEQGRWKEAQELALQVLEKRNKVLGDNHPTTLATAAFICTRYRNHQDPIRILKQPYLGQSHCEYYIGCVASSGGVRHYSADGSTDPFSCSFRCVSYLLVNAVEFLLTQCPTRSSSLCCALSVLTE